MATTYAIGDIHGRLDVLLACIERIAQHRVEHEIAAVDATVVFLGDYIDRGPKSKAVLDRLIEGPQDGVRWITLTGNHERMALVAHHNPDEYWKWWQGHGGLATSMNYPQRKISLEHLKWLSDLTAFYQDDHRLYVHAGIDQRLPLSAQTEDIVIWARHPRNHETPILDSPLYIVHGHTPHMDGPVVLETRCNLDTQSYRTGMQAIAVFDDSLPGKPVKMLTASAGYVGTDR